MNALKIKKKCLIANLHYASILHFPAHDFPQENFRHRGGFTKKSGGWLEPFKTKLFLSHGDKAEKIELAFVCTGC